MTDKICNLALCIFLALMPFWGIMWILSVPDYFQLGLVSEQSVTIVLGLGVAAAFLKYPYGEKAGYLDLLLAVIGCGVWMWA